MDTPIPTYIAAIIRMGLNAAAGALATKGAIGADQTELVVGAGLALVSLAWSIIQKRNAHAALKDAVAAPAGLPKPL